MPPFVALVLSILLIIALLNAEQRINQDISYATWVPFLWMFFIGTRFPSQWLDVGASMTSHDEYLEGSPVDQAVFLGLYAAAITILIRRKFSWTGIFSANLWICIFLLYGLISISWSDYPWTAFKRFTKVLEHVAMALVILTEPNPAQALDALFRRFLAFSVVLSVLFFKYYPELGRAFDQWTGQPVNVGVTADKNALGHICLIGVVFCASSLLSALHRNVGRHIRWKRAIDVMMLGALFWLLSVADAKTALVCSALGIAVILVFTRTRLGGNPNAVLMCIVAVVLLAIVLESVFQLKEIGIEALGRNPTLTDRTFVWDDVLAVPNNALFGTGFESFWLGPRIDVLWQKYWWRPNQAHNGYIETYINLGSIGVALLLLMMASCFVKALRSVQFKDPFGSVRVALIMAIIIFNYTDATFKAVHILYFMFFLMSLTTERAPTTSGSNPGGGFRGARQLRV